MYYIKYMVRVFVVRMVGLEPTNPFPGHHTRTVEEGRSGNPGALDSDTGFHSGFLLYKRANMFTRLSGAPRHHLSNSSLYARSAASNADSW